MTPAVLFPSATTAAIKIIEAAQPAIVPIVPVSGSVPNPRPAAFVTVLLTGGVRDSLIADAAQVTIEAWAGSDVASHDLAQKCRTALHAARNSNIDGYGVYRVEEFGGPVNLPDPLSNQSRHTFTVVLHLRGSAV